MARKTTTKRTVGKGDEHKGSPRVWNMMKSYSSDAIVPSMRKKLGQFAGKNIHK